MQHRPKPNVNFQRERGTRILHGMNRIFCASAACTDAPLASAHKRSEAAKHCPRRTMQTCPARWNPSNQTAGPDWPALASPGQPWPALVAGLAIISCLCLRFRGRYCCVSGKRPQTQRGRNTPLSPNYGGVSSMRSGILAARPRSTSLIGKSDRVEARHVSMCVKLRWDAPASNKACLGIAQGGQVCSRRTAMGPEGCHANCLAKLQL